MLNRSGRCGGRCMTFKAVEEPLSIGTLTKAQSISEDGGLRMADDKTSRVNELVVRIKDLDVEAMTALCSVIEVRLLE